MKLILFTVIICILSVVASLLMTACNDDTVTPLPSPTPPPKPIEITIGQLADMTGIVAAGYYPHHVIRNVAEYYNSEDIIPNVKFRVITYDTQYDPARNIPGYEKLKQGGAELIFTQTQHTAPILKTHINNDGMLLFAPPPTMEEDVIDPPGYVFGLGTLPEYEIFTLLTWIAENDWDWENKGPAKIGATMWKDAYSNGLINGLKAYCSEHPEQFELIDAFLFLITFGWSSGPTPFTECDYVLPPIPPHPYMKDFRDSGASTNFIGTISHTYFMSEIIASGVQEEANDMLVIMSSPWLTDTSESTFGQIAKAVANDSDYWMGHKDDTLYQPTFQHTVHDVYIIMSAIEHAIDIYGNEGFNSQNFYESLKTFSFDVDGCAHSFSETKRTSNDTLGIYRIDADNQTLTRADSEWIPIITEP